MVSKNGEEVMTRGEGCLDLQPGETRMRSGKSKQPLMLAFSPPGLELKNWCMQETESFLGAYN